MKRALILAAHTDDQIWCAGAIQKLSDQFDVSLRCFSECAHPDLTQETIASCDILGISDIDVMTFPVRRFSDYRQTILESMVRMNANLDPDLVFTHTSFDNHQDHKVIYEETIRAFKDTTVFGYEEPWNELQTNLRGCIEVSKDNVDVKLAAAKAYKSQQHRAYFNPNFIWAWAAMRGSQHNCESGYAECYEVIKLRL